MKNSLRRRIVAVVLLSLTCAGVARADDVVEIDWTTLRGVDGTRLDVDDAKWKVVCFLGCECPLARLYGPRVSELAKDFTDDGVRVIGVNSNPQDSVADIKQYITDYGLTFPIVNDRRQSLAKSFGARRTPEVFVLDASNRVCYQGRIDDQYIPGISRAKPTKHDLRDAVKALVAGKKVPIERTEAVGCLITFKKQPPKSTDTTTAVTFTRDVAPILNQHCVECHRAGEIGPFALTDYDEVVGWGEMMLEVIEQKRMPPWHADPRHGDFVGARMMPKEAVATLTAWVDQGMPRGDEADLPPTPEWPDGWHLSSSPDIEFAMGKKPFKVPADGTVEYQYFVVDPKWKEDQWVVAAQVIPGDASVVHHAIVFVRPPDGTYSRGIGWMGGYVPGQRTAKLPTGHARHIPAGSKLVFQMHYTPNGRVTNDLTKVGVWLGEPAEITHEVTTQVALNHNFELPPGEKDVAVDLSLDTFARHSELLGMMPHMHLRGKSFRLDVRRADKRETLLSVPAYDFNWQHWYQLQKPLDLGKVESLDMQVRFDNSAANPTNPDAREFVTWGDQTWQEMAVAFLDVAHPRDKPRVYQRRTKKKSPEEIAKRTKQIDDEVTKFLKQLDGNNDGIVERDETPDAFRRFGFNRIDQNRDGKIERSEIEAQASRRF